MRIGVTQRVEVVASYGETRDCLDQRWTAFLEACGLIPVPIPNTLKGPVDFVSQMEITGILFSGGNDLCFLPDAINGSSERDRTEEELLRFGYLNNMPMIGVCRGMQMMVNESGEGMVRVNNHVATRHSIRATDAPYGRVSREVNSFHNWGLWELRPDSVWQVTSISDDGSIESLCHQTKNVNTIMWHPERETNFHLADIELFKRSFRK